MKEGRRLDKDEINVLKAIDTKDFSVLPESYHPADLAYLAYHGYLVLAKEAHPLSGLWWPEKAVLTEKGRAAIKAK